MALKELYMKSGQGFILVFSLTQLGSVNELGPLREQIVRVKNAKVGQRLHMPLVRKCACQANRRSLLSHLRSRSFS